MSKIRDFMQEHVCGLIRAHDLVISSVKSVLWDHALWWVIDVAVL